MVPCEGPETGVVVTVMFPSGSLSFCNNPLPGGTMIGVSSVTVTESLAVLGPSFTGLMVTKTVSFIHSAGKGVRYHKQNDYKCIKSGIVRIRECMYMIRQIQYNRTM